MSDWIDLVEVGPRDGLQNEKTPIATEVKVGLVNRLLDCGFPNVEAAAFVSPKWVPQMADGAQVLASIQRTGAAPSAPIISALVPNEKGMQGAVAGGVNEIVIFTAASEAFAQRNINCSIDESIERFKPVVALARTQGIQVRASISCCLGCPYEGAVAPSQVARVVKKLMDLGVDRIDIADTIGVGTAGQVKAVVQAAAQEAPVGMFSGHFHDTYGQALANIIASLEVGVRIFHSSVAGLGGCPYAKGATGNVASEDVLYLLNGLGLNTGVDLNALVHTGHWISEQLGKPYGSRAGRALWTRMQGVAAS